MPSNRSTTKALRDEGKAPARPISVSKSMHRSKTRNPSRKKRRLG